MKDWLHDDEHALADYLGMSVRTWRKTRRKLIDLGLLRCEAHPVEGPILRATHAEHIAAVGLMIGGRQ
jgi:hypothetical protein